jgi:hypothetical protein
MLLHLLTVRPDFISRYFAAGVLERVVVVHNHGAGDALNDGFEPGVQCAALHLVGRNDIGEATASISADKDFSGCKIPRHRMIAVVPQMRRDEDKGKDQRDHYIVMEAATLVRPEEIAFENTAHTQLCLSHREEGAPAPSSERRDLHSFYLGAITVCPPMYGASASGTRTEPSAC